MEMVAELFQEEIYQLPPPVVVVINVPWREIAEPERHLLAKILNAIEYPANVKLSLAAVKIITQPLLNLTTLPFEPQQVIAFTQVPSGIPINEVVKTPTYQLVVGLPLAELITQDEAKKRLWQALRAQFGMATKAS
jgi:hypothetical protein